MILLVKEELCITCGTCEEICPLDVFRVDMVAGRSVIAYGEHCQTCYQCELECPSGALHVDPFTRQKRNVL